MQTALGSQDTDGICRKPCLSLPMKGALRIHHANHRPPQRESGRPTSVWCGLAPVGQGHAAIHHGANSSALDLSASGWHSCGCPISPQRIAAFGRSMASGGSDFGSKPTTKSAMVSLRRALRRRLLWRPASPRFSHPVRALAVPTGSVPRDRRETGGDRSSFRAVGSSSLGVSIQFDRAKDSSSKFNERNQVSKSARSTKIIASACVLPVHRSVASMIVLVEFAIS